MPRICRRWTAHDYKFLKENYLHLSYKDMAAELGRSVYAVQHKMIMLGLKLPDAIRNKRVAELNRDRDITGENNPNWKGGRSKNPYFYKKIQKERYPERVKAREIVHRELRSGRLVREDCSVCGESEAEAHHDDYNKPLDIKWLCKKCHREYHRNIGTKCQ